MSLLLVEKYMKYISDITVRRNGIKISERRDSEKNTFNKFLSITVI